MRRVGRATAPQPHIAGFDAEMTIGRRDVDPPALDHLAVARMPHGHGTTLVQQLRQIRFPPPDMDGDEDAGAPSRVKGAGQVTQRQYPAVRASDDDDRAWVKHAGSTRNPAVCSSGWNWLRLYSPIRGCGFAPDFASSSPG